MYFWYIDVPPQRRATVQSFWMRDWKYSLRTENLHEAWSQGRTGGRNSQSTVRVQRNFVGTHGARPELRFTRLKRYSATVMLYKKFNEPFATNPGTSENHWLGSILFENSLNFLWSLHMLFSKPPRAIRWWSWKLKTLKRDSRPSNLLPFYRFILPSTWSSLKLSRETFFPNELSEFPHANREYM